MLTSQQQHVQICSGVIAIMRTGRFHIHKDNKNEAHKVFLGLRLCQTSVIVCRKMCLYTVQKYARGLADYCLWRSLECAAMRSM